MNKKKRTTRPSFSIAGVSQFCTICDCPPLFHFFLTLLNRSARDLSHSTRSRKSSTPSPFFLFSCFYLSFLLSSFLLPFSSSFLLLLTVLSPYHSFPPLVGMHVGTGVLGSNGQETGKRKERKKKAGMGGQGPSRGTMYIRRMLTGAWAKKKTYSSGPRGCVQLSVLFYGWRGG